MPLSITGLQCCGVKEIGGLRNIGNTPGTFDGFERELRIFVSSYKDGNITNAYFIFTAVVQHGSPPYGEAFKAFILKNNLGEVQETSVNKNPNSGNQLRVYLWTVDQRNLKAWYTAAAVAAVPLPAPPKPAVPAVSAEFAALPADILNRRRPRAPRATPISAPPPLPRFDHET